MVGLAKIYAGKGHIVHVIWSSGPNQFVVLQLVVGRIIL